MREGLEKTYAWIAAQVENAKTDRTAGLPE
jgi:hypothetical protein